MAPCGCNPSNHDLVLWKYYAKKTTLTIAFDDFGATRLGKRNTEHLVKALKEKCEDAEANWERSKLCGINLKWDCTRREFQLNVLGLVKRIQKRHECPTPDKPQDSPTDHTTPNHGKKQQRTKENTVLKKT